MNLILKVLTACILSLLVHTNLYAFSLVGVWKLVSIEHKSDGNTILQDCKSPTGTIIYTPEGYMAANINCMKSKGSKEPSFEPKDMTFYSGTYLLKNHKVTHFVKNASDPTYYGKHLERKLEVINNNKIILKVINKKGGEVKLTWKKLS